MSRRPSLSHVLGRWGGIAVLRWRRVAAGTATVLAVLAALTVSFGGAYDDTFTVPGSDSQAAYDLLAERFPDAAGDTATVVFAVADGLITDPPRQAAVATALEAVSRQPRVVMVASPFGAQAQGQISRDGTVAFADVVYDERADQLGREPTRRLEDATASLAAAGVDVSLRGPVVDVAKQPPVVSVGELVGVAVAVLVLTVVLGSITGMLVTLLVSFVSLGTALALVTLGTGVANVPTTAVTLAVMLGLGVGIDYALLIAARHRENLAAGADVPSAAAAANRTAGVSVLAAAAIVIVAITGLVVVGVPFVGTMGVATAVTVALVAAGSVLLLPAGFGAAGDRLRPRRTGAPAGTGSFTRWAQILVRRPVLPAVIGVVALVGLAAPALGLRLGTPDDGVRGSGETQRIAYDHLARSFGPGLNGPLLVAAALPADRAAGEAALDRVVRAAAADRGVAAVTPVTSNARGDAAVLTVIPTSAPQDAQTSRLIERLRVEVIPRAVGGTGTRVHVGGLTATNDDLSERIADRLPWFIGLVVTVAILLLAAAFRSVRVPLVSAAFNVLSVFAAYGLVVLVFQQGLGNELLGVEDTVPIVSFLPLFMFALLFGLSMDYNVFQQSRIREAYLHGPSAGDARAAVVEGVGRTGSVIAAAGTIMVAVFGSFLLAHDVTIKMIAFGLAAAILVDVLLVRFILAPAVMVLLGDGAWRLPGWLDRILPTVALEGSSTAPVDEPALVGSR
jgi:RND superfamily putative drug exporter